MTSLDVETIVSRATADQRERSGSALFDDVRGFLRRFVVFPSAEALDAVTLWAVHTHLMDRWETSPRLALLSPEPSSGKTRTLELLEFLVQAPMSSISASTASVFRSLRQGQRTLLFDEVDTIFGRHGNDDPAEDLRALLNAGHRRGATVPRCVPPQYDVVEFPVFAAAALAGLGNLPETLMTRAVVIHMRRRTSSERIEPFRRRIHGPDGEALRCRLASWASAVLSDLPWPEMPPGVTDRPADVWEPLIAVADAAGGHWPRTARTACTALVKVAEGGAASLGTKLLFDIRRVLFETGTDRMSTDDLLRCLHALDESPWGEFRGKPLNPRELARLVARYDVHPHQFKTSHQKVRGYSVSGNEKGGGLCDAFARYLPPLLRSGTSGTPPANGSTFKSNATHSTCTGSASLPNHDAPTGVVPEPAAPKVPAKDFQGTRAHCPRCGRNVGSLYGRAGSRASAKFSPDVVT